MCSGIGFDLGELFFIDDRDIDPVSVAPFFELNNPGRLIFVSGDNDLSTGIHGKAFLFAIFPPETISVPGESGLQ